MTTRTWVGGLHSGYNALNAQAWSPAGAPQPGDYLQMVSGVMSVSHYDLAGNELHLGNGQTDAGYNMLNLNDGADVTANAVGRYLNFGDPLRINVTGTNHFAADNLEAVQGTVSLAAHSNLVVTGNLQFAYFGDIVGTGTITNNGLISIAQGDISAHVNGHGTLQLHAYHDGLGIQTITGAVDAGQDVQLITGASGSTQTELVHPDTFKGTVDLVPGPGLAHYNNALEVDGVHASRMDIRNDMLRLYGAGNKPLWQVHEHMPAGFTASMNDTATGTEITFAPPRQLVG